MLDRYFRIAIDPPLNGLARLIVKLGARPNHVTWAGFGVGCAGFIALAMHLYIVALALLCLNRLADGLDGAIARVGKNNHGPSAYGAYLDIVLDMIIYAGYVFFFAVGHPSTWPYAGGLLFAFMGTCASFLGYAVIAEKNGYETLRNGEKSFFHAGGLIEGSETFAYLALICLFPELFKILTLVFIALCVITIYGRIHMARDHFGHLRDQ